jgi:enhancing lycopene biosynthesis protein 2
MKKFAVILAGCGVYDGAEIHEAVMTLYAIKKSGAEYDIFAPDIEQYHVLNHLTGKEIPEKRNVLVESARIARGAIKPLSLYKAEEYDVLIFPGGFGVAKNLCSFAFDGDKCIVNAEVEKAIKDTYSLKKPIGAVCISPVLLARVLGNKVKLTIGNDTGTATKINKMGAEHMDKRETEILVDREFKVVTSPCYMLDTNILDIAVSAENTIRALLELI